MDIKYLDLLAKEFPTKKSVITEVINLNAILALPKGTEHFISDVHGEFEAFQHILKNGSGRIRQKIAYLYHDELDSTEQNSLATLIYYPQEKINLTKDLIDNDEKLNDWYQKQLIRLVTVAQEVSSKYTRSKVRKAIPQEYSYVIEELLFTPSRQKQMSGYYNNVIETIVTLGIADDFIVEMSCLIQRLTIDHLHLVGDIYDRGPEPDKIIDSLMSYHSVDIQWGNHDVLWMAAALGSTVCQANVLRISSRYNNLDIIEKQYGMSIRFLVDFANKTYPNPHESFWPKLADEDSDMPHEKQRELASIQQAMAMIQFKLEGQIIEKQPDLNMSERSHFSKIDFNLYNYVHNGRTFQLNQQDFLSVNPKNPLTLTEEESKVVRNLSELFSLSDKLRKHVDYLFSVGSMYLVYNGNLLYHGCIPLDSKGEFKEFKFNDESYSGKELFDFFETVLRESYQAYSNGCKLSDDQLALLWYLWTGELSPLFGKDKMTTFERYFIQDKESHVEVKNPYYFLREEEETCDNILINFGLNPDTAHIINGHTPVKEVKGESPIKSDGKLLVIDGGFSKPYQSTTGIAGYTLLFNSYGMEIAVHQAFSGSDEAISKGQDLISVKRDIYQPSNRILVSQTDIGRSLQEQISDLLDLKTAYDQGILQEKSN
ncbi:fructose-1,6-bisphosphatase [Vagococcus coleopterorum]|uniref:Fructose-1,6-bisphosphatase class 3 n=1 Tax=Vagococcus coleopterorum TaxID=2714946 RepID=A0A6G8ANX1_9ENTE|nr:fructose-1,6-bisphosphatase [Vagococcus coleopterorum]QIL46642.1 fructose-1,6-bisphosphatase [Vagococcus coleopterorum]